jgi:hypothetical protein
MPSTDSKTGRSAGEVDVRAALIGLQLLAFARRWRPDTRGALWRIAIAAAEGFEDAGELGGWQREAALETTLSRCAAIASVALERLEG